MEEQFHLISLDLLPRVFFGDLLSALFILLPPPPSGDARGFPVEEASVSGQFQGKGSKKYLLGHLQHQGLPWVMASAVFFWCWMAAVNGDICPSITTDPHALANGGTIERKENFKDRLPPPPQGPPDNF